MRTVTSFSVANLTTFKKGLLLWGQQFKTTLFLDSNNYKQHYSTFNCCLAVKKNTAIKTNYKNAFKKLKEYQSTTKDYIFGYISYDVKNDVETLSSNNFDGLDFADLFFFQPQKLIFIKEKKIEFHYLKKIDTEIKSDFLAIKKIAQTTTLKTEKNTNKQDIKIKLRLHKEAYYKKIDKILRHIKRGDIYEANFCQEFYAEKAIINPYQTFNHLNKISKPPFAAFFRIRNQYVLCASPERYLRKEAQKIISQPIKGTEKRMLNSAEDQKTAYNLAQNPKERAENIMIVDLVRNDLSKTALENTVKVEELCKVYSFKQVHQLISTIVSEVKPSTHPVKILQDTFPMGSMTGAPKIAAMEIIENLENTKRGLYSGAIGYFSPSGDFDFNVVIRSILYNSEKKYVSYSVGSAITAQSNPEKEYEECLLKAKAMKFVLLN